ncbi:MULTISPECIES: hypothetical protein [Xanthomonas]|uniref:Transmembrane protein n=1 Tax=Xanthomonas rydalmerensis TaxID=3046274 RepID=A0ABZ0JKB8_9XANT|nr:MULTISPECIES: hypothetical protein [unclassified Xanthomonas]MXV08842.1 hypothetical protein [Xanthomonas sp. LMG 9002]WOS39453.1 hypothetical protein QN243_13555 [Xanthomonas sp. DM-2023]WOS43637.1 hypothetical protein QN242_13555 [Xanthomonas sp. DM-2023]WOS47818.1 hypothetical protein QN240_13555 [Xanthomonas sp. DM-2023]WOS51996.1 hypothetical protein QN244_13555 [Xanthomonas sp. DM-2023]
MGARTEFVAGSAAAGAVAMAAATALDQSGTSLPWTDSLKWALPALAAAAAGAWLALRWTRRVPVASAGALAVRTLLLAVLAYLPALALYVLVAVLASAASVPAGQHWQLLLMAFVFGCLPLLWAALPFSMIEFLLCRRYLRHTRVLAGRP